MEAWRVWLQIPITLKRSWIRIRIHITVRSWIRIRIKVKRWIRIRNKGITCGSATLIVGLFYFYSICENNFMLARLGRCGSAGPAATPPAWSSTSWTTWSSVTCSPPATPAPSATWACPPTRRCTSTPPGSVADPDPHVFGPPGSGSTSQRYGSVSGSFYHHAKIVR
jgi:hypothetical protein